MHAKCREKKELCSHGPYPAAYVPFLRDQRTVVRLPSFHCFLVFFRWPMLHSHSAARSLETYAGNGAEITRPEEKKIKEFVCVF